LAIHAENFFPLASWGLEAKPGVRMEFIDGINRIYGMGRGKEGSR
jgi:hypothetical protein